MTTVNGGPPAKSTALAGIRICDLSGILAGAGATRILAAFGAQVIRVEDPVKQGRWDITRGASPFVDDRRGTNFGGTFNNHNVEKLGITLNLREERGRELFLQLVSTSDAVTENFSAGVMDRLGLGYDRLREVNDKIVYVANSGFGKTGPYAKYKTFGPIVQAVSGLTFASGLPDQPPAGWGYSYMDHMGANGMAFALLAALVHRNRTGRGVAIDMSCTEVALTLAGPELLDFTVNDRPPRTSGTVNSNADNFPAMAPHGIYPGAEDDTWVSIACRDDDDWRRLCSVVSEDWTREPDYTALEGRLAHRDTIDHHLRGWTRSRPAAATERLLRDAAIPSSKVSSPPDRIDNDPATAQWGLWPTVHHAEMGDVRVDGMPMHMSETDWVIARGAPCLGEHNRHVYGDLLGLAAEEIDELAAAGII